MNTGFERGKRYFSYENETIDRC